MSSPRHISRFESADGALSITLPMLEGETESAQEYRTAFEHAVGMNYAVDLHGALSAPLGVGQERLRAFVSGSTSIALDVEVDLLRRRLYEIGRGRLWSVGADGTERWSWARCNSMPQMTVKSGIFQTMPVSIEFTRLSDWFAAIETSIVTTVSASPTSITITNDGTAPVRDIVFLLASRSTTGFSAPRITNGTTGETFVTTRVATSSTHRWRVDTGRYAVEYSTNSGTTWTNDYALFSTGSTQVGFMRLLPGPQVITITGAPTSTLTISFYATYR